MMPRCLGSSTLLEGFMEVSGFGFLVTAIRTFNPGPSLMSEIIQQLLVTLLTHARLAPLIKISHFPKTWLFDGFDHSAFVLNRVVRNWYS